MKNKNIFRHVVTLCITFVLCFTMLGAVSVKATDTETIIALSDVVGAAGQEVVVPLTIENNTGIAAFRFRVSYNTDVLELLSVEASGTFADGTLACDTNTDEQNTTILWYSLTDITANGVIANLKFKIAEGYHGTLPLEIAYRESEILDQNREMLTCIVKGGLVTTAGAFSGNVNAYGGSIKKATVKLFKDGAEHYTATVTNGSFKIDYVMPGKYTVEVLLDGYITKSYELIMGIADAQKSYDLVLIGDANYNGAVNNRDLAALMQYVNGWNIEINFECADLNRDNKLNNKDYVILMRYINGWES